MSSGCFIDLYPAIGFSPSFVSDERKLVIICARRELSAWMKKEAERIVSIEEFSWERVLELSEAYRVAPFVYGHIQAFKSKVPENIMAVLRKISAEKLAANLLALQDVKLLAAVFNKSDIEPIFTKGAAFLAEIYTAPGLRDLSDIDILVREKDFVRASKLLEDEGFRFREETGTSAGYRTQRLYEKEGHIAIDLHKGFIGRRLHDEMLCIDWDEVWRKKRDLVLGGERICALDIAHTLVYACIHLAIQHSLSGLIWYVDLHEFIMKHSGVLDWGEVVSLAAKHRVRKPVYHVLSMTKNMMGTPVPGEVLDELAQAEGKLDNWALLRIKKANREIDYLAEMLMFDSYAASIRFAVLSLVRYPSLVGHFSNILSRAVSGLLPQAPVRKEAGGKDAEGR